ncbi:hypothetical protein EDB85DRAFT_2028193, partial [Lactarius pseudohatsudake]
MRKGGGLGVACPRVPSSRTYGGGNGKDGAGGGVPSRAPFPRTGGARPMGKGGVEVAACRGRRVLMRPFMGREGPGREGGRRRRALVRTPSVGMGGAAKGEGVGPKAKGRRALVRIPSTRMEKGGAEGRDGGVPLCPLLPCEWEGRCGERGRGGRRGQGAGRTGGDREKGQRRAHARPFHTARTWGKGRGGRRALVRRLSARTGWRGQRVREGGAAVSALVRPLSALERGGGQCGGKGRRGRGRLTPRAMKGKGWGVGLSSCVFSSTRMGRATGTEGGREGERRRGGDETSYRLPILYESGGTHN